MSCLTHDSQALFFPWLLNCSIHSVFFALVEMVWNETQLAPLQPTFLPQLHLSTETLALQCSTRWFVGFVVWRASVGLVWLVVGITIAISPLLQCFSLNYVRSCCSFKQSQTLSLLLLLFFFFHWYLLYLRCLYTKPSNIKVNAETSIMH